MSDEQLAIITAALAPHWLEILVWVATILVTASAIYALYYARDQILAARDNTKALFVVDLDRRWEGHEMKEARARWKKMRNFIRDTVKANHAHLNPQQKLAKSGEICSAHLYQLMNSSDEENIEDYTSIMSILGFFETMGYVVSKGFITGDEIVELYGDSIQEFDRLCFAHIEKRREDRQTETGRPTDLYEKARDLIFHARGYYERGNS